MILNEQIKVATRKNESPQTKTLINGFFHTHIYTIHMSYDNFYMCRSERENLGNVLPLAQLLFFLIGQRSGYTYLFLKNVF